MNFDPPRPVLPDELEDNHGAKPQIFATFAVSLAAFNAGLVIGWAQSGRIVLPSNRTDEVARELEENHLDRQNRVNGLLVNSLYSSLVAAFLLTILSQRFGRQFILMVSSVIGLIMASMFLLDRKINSSADSGSTAAAGWWLSGPVIISGITFGTMLLSEAIHKSIRGTSMAVCFFQLNFGILLALTAGSYLEQHTIYCCLCALFGIQTVLVHCIAESPLYLVMQSKLLQAEGSLFWYCGKNRPIALGELTILTNHYASLRSTFMESLKSVWDQNVLTLFVLKIVILVVDYWVLIEFRTKMYTSTKGHLSKKNVDVVIAAVQTVVSLIVVLLIDPIGRKPLMYFSHVCNTATLLTTWLYYSFAGADSTAKSVEWFPIFCSAVFTASFTVSLVSYMSVFINEIFPMKIKFITSTIGGLLIVIAMLMTVWFRNYVHGYVGFGFNNFWWLCIIECCALLTTWLYSTETKGVTLVNVIS